eukprot:jgi/Tetstr1/453099/TSEL_003939.t1
MIVEARPAIRLAGRDHGGPNRFLDAAAPKEDASWMDEHGEQVTADILAVGRQLEGVTPDMLLRLAGIETGSDESLDSRLESIRKLFRAKSRNNDGKMLTVEAVCEEVIEQRDSPLVGLDWLMMLTADRIHLEVVDVHGCSRGMTVGVEEFISTGIDGLGIRVAYATGMASDEPQSGSSRKLRGGAIQSSPVACALPVARDANVAGDAPIATLLPWTSRSQHARVVSVLCETKSAAAGGEWQLANPRCVARSQLQRLCDAGLRLHSAFEPTFIVMSENRHYAERMAQTELDELHDDLEAAGVACQPLAADGNEVDGVATVTAKLAEMGGLDAADAAFRFRNGTREFFKLRDGGRAATFMSQPFTAQPISSMRYRHRLAPAIGINDAKGYHSAAAAGDGTGLSATERHWLAGLQRHAPALAALGAPTVNCYQALVIAPSKTRSLSMIRSWADAKHPLVAVSPGSAYSADGSACWFDNQYCRAPANPYLVLAATVAAGLDGLENELEPSWGDGDELAEVALPASLAEALAALEADEVVGAALGPALMAWFSEVKETELCLLADGPAAATLDMAAVESALSLQRRVYTNLI